jgi:hypothetical protein
LAFRRHQLFAVSDKPKTFEEKENVDFFGMETDNEEAKSAADILSRTNSNLIFDDKAK